MIEYTCTECGAAMASPRSLEGLSETCPTCGRAVPVPVDLPPGALASGFAPAGEMGDSFDPMDVLDGDEPVVLVQPKGKIHSICPACGRTRAIHLNELGEDVSCEPCGKQWRLPALTKRCHRHVQLVGFNHFNEDGIPRQKILRFCRDGESLLLHVEHDGIHDAEVVRVLTMTPECLGHLPLPESAELAPKLKAGLPYEVVIAHKASTNNVIRAVDLEVAHYC